MALFHRMNRTVGILTLLLLCGCDSRAEDLDACKLSALMAYRPEVGEMKWGETSWGYVSTCMLNAGYTQNHMDICEGAKPAGALFNACWRPKKTWWGEQLSRWLNWPD
jgi:hypothetical protein